MEPISYKRYTDILDVLIKNFKRFHDIDGREQSDDIFRDLYSVLLPQRLFKEIQKLL